MMLRITHLFAAMILGGALLAQPAMARNVRTIEGASPVTVIDRDELQATGTISARELLESLPSATGPRIWAGGGVQFLSLPDIKFTGRGGLQNFRHQKNTSSDWLDAGGAISGGFAMPIRGLPRLGTTILTVKGFAANIEDDERTRCSGSAGYCVVIDPTDQFVATSGSLEVLTDRDTDYWGAQAELKFPTGVPAQVKPDVFRYDYFLAGFGIRGIDQHNRLRGSSGIDFRYDETLDTTYTGGYVGIGGEYSFGFVPIVGKWIKGKGGLLDRWGLRTYLDATAGLYNADTDYIGKFASGDGTFGSTAYKSNNEIAVLVNLSLETRKQFSPRTSVSLFTDYEYISSVAKMDYASPGHPTRIDSEGLFASRTTLRLNIGLGSSELYARSGYYD